MILNLYHGELIYIKTNIVSGLSILARDESLQKFFLNLTPDSSESDDAHDAGA